MKIPDAKTFGIGEVRSAVGSRRLLDVMNVNSKYLTVSTACMKSRPWPIFCLWFVYMTMRTLIRGCGTGGAGGTVAPPTFDSSIIVHSYSTTKIFGRMNIC